MDDFIEFNKIARLSRDCTITEKIDGTNAQIYINEDGEFYTGSRNRWVTPENDNYGFSRWAHENKDELMKLGIGRHFGEWWGAGIQRKYGMEEKIFSLFNVSRYAENCPACCSLVPILYQGIFATEIIDICIGKLELAGSIAAKGFMNPEGIVVYHEAARVYFKKTIKNDETPKSKVSA